LSIIITVLDSLLFYYSYFITVLWKMNSCVCSTVRYLSSKLKIVLFVLHYYKIIQSPRVYCTKQSMIFPILFFLNVFLLVY
jgi:hypothetical protein